MRRSPLQHNSRHVQLIDIWPGCECTGASYPEALWSVNGSRIKISRVKFVGVACSNLYTLEGGVHNYLREEGADLWNGSLFVFDGRMAVPPPGLF